MFTGSIKIALAVLLLSTGAAATEATFSIRMSAARTLMSYSNQNAPTTNYGTGTAVYLQDSAYGSSAYIYLVDSCLNDSIRLRSLPYIKSYVLKLKYTITPSLNWGWTSGDTLWVGRGRRNNWSETQICWSRYKTVSGNWTRAGGRDYSADIDTTGMSRCPMQQPSNSDSLLVLDITSTMQQMDGADTARQYGGIILMPPIPTGNFAANPGGSGNFFSDDHTTTANQPLAVITLSDVPQPESSPAKSNNRRKSLLSYKERIHAYCIID